MRKKQEKTSTFRVHARSPKSTMPVTVRTEYPATATARMAGSRGAGYTSSNQASSRRRATDGHRPRARGQENGGGGLVGAGDGQARQRREGPPGIEVRPQVPEHRMGEGEADPDQCPDRQGQGIREGIAASRETCRDQHHEKGRGGGVGAPYSPRYGKAAPLRGLHSPEKRAGAQPRHREEGHRHRCGAAGLEEPGRQQHDEAPFARVCERGRRGGKEEQDASESAGREGGPRRRPGPRESGVREPARCDGACAPYANHQRSVSLDPSRSQLPASAPCSTLSLVANT